MAAHHQKLVGLYMKTDDEGQYFSTVDKFCLKHPSHSPIEFNHAWWSYLVVQRTDMNGCFTFQSLKSVTIAGRLCTVGTVFVRQLPSLNTKAVFFRISEAVVSKRILFIMEEMDTLFFCQQRFCFIVSPLKTFVLVSLKDLVFDAPLHSFNYFNELHVFPNYYQIM